MGNFGRDNRSRGRRNDRGGFGNREMHEAICSECGDKCQIPFRPTGDRPVFCSECFSKQKGGDSNYGNRNHRDRHDNNFSRPRFENKKMFSATCSKCGNQCEVPFRPTGQKPVYCSNCFGKENSNTNKSSGDMMAQFQILNNKLDRLIKLLIPIKTEVKVQEKKIVKETKPVEKDHKISSKKEKIIKKKATKKKKK